MTVLRNQRLTVKPLTGTIGAEIVGLDLASGLSDEDRTEVFQAFLDHKVLVIRDKPGLDPKALVDFSRTFGPAEREAHPLHADFNDIPEVKVLHSDAANKEEDRDSSWHMDGSQRGTGMRLWISILQAIDVPPVGRDTAFSDMERAFYRLSASMQEFLIGLKANHSWGSSKPGAPSVEHEVAPIHPYTGRRSLYVSPGYTTDIIGLREDESDLLLKFLLNKVHRLEHQIRVAWEPGMIVIWDNARTLHSLVMDANYPRVMHRIMTLLPEDGVPWYPAQRALENA